MTSRKPYLWLIRAVGVIVPRRLRSDWRREWESEIAAHDEALTRWKELAWRNKRELMRHSLGAFWDALWLQSRRWEDEMIQDLRFGLRMLRKNPGFALIAALTLALGIGANTAIFSVVNGVLLKPLPYPEPERLLRVFERNDHLAPDFGMSPANFRDYRRAITTFESLACYVRQDLELAGQENAERLMGMRVSAGYFRTLGTRPMLGREFTLEEEIPDATTVVMLSYGLWRNRFNSDPSIVGKTISLSARNYTVVGVTPAGMQHVGGGWRPLPHGESVDIWQPMRLGPNRPRGVHIANVIGRLKPGFTNTQADAELKSIGARLAEQFPEVNREWRPHTLPLREEIVAGSKKTLLLLLAAVFLVLLIACVNVANLMLARAASREQEMAVRAALGAGRVRIVRQLLVESVALSLIGGLLGLSIAKLAIQIVVKLAPERLPRLQMIHLDSRVLVFTVLISLLTGVAFGLAPAFHSFKIQLVESLKEGGRVSVGGKRQRGLRNALVVSEIALALLLAVGAGLLTRSFGKLQQTDPGFQPAGVLTMSLNLPPARYSSPEDQINFSQRLIERVSGLPGVRSAGLTSDLPWSGYDNATVIQVEGGQARLEQGSLVGYHFTSSDYMRTIGVPLLAGRWLDVRDARGSHPVVLINQSLARQFWPGEIVVGKRIAFGYTPGKEPIWTEVVGVVGDVKSAPDAVRAEPAYYWPLAQEPYPELRLAIRAEQDPFQLVEAVRREVRGIDPNLPLSDINTLEALAGVALQGRRFSLQVVALFALTALSLAAIGVYGVISNLVAHRTHEIAVRMALGAPKADVLQMILRCGLRLTFAGLVVGAAASLAATRVMRTWLYEVSATDPWTFLSVALLLVFVALIASLVPAWRATKIDPLEALRRE